MLVSYNLLREIVKFPAGVTPQDIAEKLTLRGVEVEKLAPLAAATELTVGLIIACTKHPESDHLNLLQVDCGNRGMFDIVCGAPNARVGIKVIVARVGAHLPAKDLVIKASMIAGYPSAGMCCSLSELGVAEELLTDEQKSGIEELPASSEVGSDDVLGLLGLDDYLFDLNILANRPDLSSLIGIARELSAIYRCSLIPLNPLFLPEDNQIPVSSKTAKCPAFGLLEVTTDGKMTESPTKLKQYLRALGYRSISLAVDLGNFMMAITGQPFHFYDLEKVKRLSGTVKFVVRDDFEGEVATLDEKIIAVKTGDIVVTDGQTPMCLAGVMGLKNVVTELNSQHFGIEAANFSYVQIRHTVKRTGLSSDSAQRFIKKVNARLLDESLRLLAAVYQAIDPSFTVVSYSLYDAVQKLPTAIPFSLEAANHRLGGNFGRAEIAEIFAALRLNWTGDLVEIPLDRPDLKEQADLEEEIFRYVDPYRLETDFSKLPITRGQRTPSQKKIKYFRDYLTAQGLFEILSYTLIDKETDRNYRIFNDKTPSFHIGNPMTADHEYVRSDLLASLIRTIDYNRDRQKDDFGIFEISNLDLAGQVNTYLALGLTGSKTDQGLLVKRPYDFYDLKGYLEGLFSILGIQSNRYQLRRSSSEFFHPLRSADVFSGQRKIAAFGQIHPSREKEPTYVMEIDLTALLAIKTSAVKFAAFSVYPDVERDFSFIVSANTTAEQLTSTIKKAVGSTLKSVDIFDVYIIDDARKSLAVKVKFTSADHTFVESELTTLQAKIIATVEEKLGGILR